MKDTLSDIQRCHRCMKDSLYQNYHDNEWWVPVHDDRIHFEFLLLETFQAWLSRYTVLKKREYFREAFDQFNPIHIATFDQQKIEELMSNNLIIRNRSKIVASIVNARVFLQIQQQYWSWDHFIRSYSNYKPIINHIDKNTDCPSRSALSDRISADLKHYGMKFIWSTIIYAHLQATGQINDHENTCRKKHLWVHKHIDI